MRLVANAVLNICRRERDLIRAKLAFIITNAEPACTFNHQVDLIGTGVRVALLLLARLETIDVGEHPFSLEQIYLLHFLGGETTFGLYVPDFHCTDANRGYERCSDPSSEPDSIRRLLYDAGRVWPR